MSFQLKSNRALTILIFVAVATLYPQVSAWGHASGGGHIHNTADFQSDSGFGGGLGSLGLSSSNMGSSGLGGSGIGASTLPPPPPPAPPPPPPPLTQANKVQELPQDINEILPLNSDNSVTGRKIFPRSEGSLKMLNSILNRSRSN